MKIIFIVRDEYMIYRAFRTKGKAMRYVCELEQELIGAWISEVYLDE